MLKQKGNGMQRILSIMMVLFITLFMAACSKPSSPLSARPRLQVWQTHTPFQGTNYVYCKRCMHFFTRNHPSKRN